MSCGPQKVRSSEGTSAAGSAFLSSESVFRHNLSLGNGPDAVLAATAVEEPDWDA